MTKNDDFMANDYHGHPNYLSVFFGLVVLFAISVIADLLKPTLGNGVALTIIFATAFIKFFMVVGSFMHLKFEPKVFLWLPIFTMFAVFCFLLLVYPDVPMVEHIISNWK